ncbi:hypothetical protein Cob_v000953 [Colletotrichum orbiculare MAFF 240422]|uniref:Uncharacterized protein n=1 Tax=Colletotrichum orbiculare (strain 104-T / ATCC 96160 / CBS 514.97 / LARS 414 / MAFF 240422) TaxID=1213857 RepID=N4VWN0_COLOR|nr:hypothetical protein Cob_v000953 [Colletotrichum orbiculare MAFF 240422]
METHNDDVEILIHVTAPSRAVDDTRYRAQAQAYLDFNPDQRTKITGGQQESDEVKDREEDEDAIPPSSQPGPANSQAPPYMYYPPIPSSEATQEHTSPPRPTFLLGQSFQSVDLSFRSVLDNANSPGLGKQANEDVIVPSSQPPTQTQETQASWVAPPSVVGDSQPGPFGSLGFSSPTHVYELLEKDFEDPRIFQAESDSQRQSQGAAPAATQAPPHHATSEAGETHEEESSDGEDDGQVVLTTSGDPPAATSDLSSSPTADKVVLRTPFAAFRKPPLQSSPGDQVIEETPCNPSRKRPLDTSPSRGNSEPPPPSSKRHRRSAPISESRSVISRSVSDAGAIATGSNPCRPLRPPNERHIRYLERCEIRPPGPPVGEANLTPDDLLTPKLRELARQFNLPKRYRPVEQKRDLRPFERGHWALDWSGWGQTLRQRAWHFLTDYILNGFAGWGVWCTRADDWTWLRVYCWGHVVGHVYLALYLASERALKTGVARWVDGAGDVVVVTNGHNNSSGESMEESEGG